MTTVLHWDPLGWSPDDALTATSDGALYGVTSGGGPLGRGTVFRVDPAAGTLTLVHAFGTGSTTDGFTPNSPLVQGADGHLYGTTFSSSQSLVPALFRVRRQSGSDTVEVIGLLEQATAGDLPVPALLASDGFIWHRGLRDGRQRTYLPVGIRSRAARRAIRSRSVPHTSSIHRPTPPSRHRRPLRATVASTA